MKDEKGWRVEGMPRRVQRGAGPLVGENEREKTWGNENFTPDDPLYEMVLNDEAIRRFGVCMREDLLDGERKRIDDVFVECSGSWWTPIDSLTYYLGDCYYSHKEELGEHLGKYYQCLEGGSSYVWTEVVPPVYFGDTCTNFDDGKVVEYDKSYYICESDACKDAGKEICMQSSSTPIPAT